MISQWGKHVKQARKCWSVFSQRR